MLLWLTMPRLPWLLVSTPAETQEEQMLLLRGQMQELLFVLQWVWAAHWLQVLRVTFDEPPYGLKDAPEPFSPRNFSSRRDMRFGL